MKILHFISVFWILWATLVEKNGLTRHFQCFNFAFGGDGDGSVNRRINESFNMVTLPSAGNTARINESTVIRGTDKRDKTVQGFVELSA